MPLRTRSRTPAPVSDSLRKLGERVRQARTEAGLSQAQLGTPHFTRAYVSALELGKIRPAMSSLEFIAGKLGKSAASFLEDEDQERERRERELEITAAAALLTRSTAVEALRRLEPLLDSATTPEEICRLRLMAGTAHNFLGHGAEALKELTAAERLAAQLKREGLQRSVTHQTAIALRTLGDLQRASSLLTDLLSTVERSNAGDRIFRMRLLRDLGAVSWDLGDYEKATAYYQSALEWAQDIGDVSGLTAVYHGLALSHRALGDLEAATLYLQKALGASEVSNDLTSAAVLHNGLAVIAAERGHTEAAYRHVDRAIELARATGPESYVPHYLNTKAECAVKAKDWDAARQYADQSIELAERTGNQRAAAAARVVLSEVARAMGLPDEGIRRLEEAAATYRTMGARQELGEVLMRLSGVAQERGDTAGAQRYAQQAYAATKTKSGLMGR
jgi:tetratricopeptide (TPR) repeat protein